MGHLFRRLPLRGHYFLVLLIALAVVKGVLYSAVVPPWQAPDEPKYFEYVWLLHEKGRLISSADASPSIQQQLVQSMAQYDYWRFWGQPQPTSLPTSFEEVWGWSSSVLGSPPLAFLFSLPAFALVSSTDIAMQLYVMRLTTVLLSVLVILVAFLVARALFPGDSIMTRAVPSFLLFMPMYSFVAGSYTNQVMADLAAALWLYVMVTALKKGFSLYRGLALLGTLAMGYLSKRASLFLIPLSVVYVPFLVFRKKGLARALTVSALAVAGMAILVLLIAALPQGQGGLRWALLDRYFWGPPGSFLRTLAAHDYLSYAYLGLLLKYFQVLFESFWGVFGWMNVPLDAAWYWLFLVLAVAATGGLAFTLLRPSERNSLTRWQRDALLLCLVAIVFAVAPILAQYSSEFSPTAVPQGRYLFPVVIPISLLMVLGLRRLFPASLARVFPFLLVAFMFFFDTVSLALYIVPFYYG